MSVRPIPVPFDQFPTSVIRCRCPVAESRCQRRPSSPDRIVRRAFVDLDGGVRVSRAFVPVRSVPMVVPLDQVSRRPIARDPDAPVPVRRITLLLDGCAFEAALPASPHVANVNAAVPVAESPGASRVSADQVALDEITDSVDALRSRSPPCSLPEMTFPRRRSGHPRVFSAASRAPRPECVARATVPVTSVPILFLDQVSRRPVTARSGCRSSGWPKSRCQRRLLPRRSYCSPRLRRS